MGTDLSTQPVCMNSSRIALLAATAAAVLWAAKATAISVAGGLDRSSLESPLFIAGLACFVVGVLALGLSLASRARPPLRVLAALGMVVLGVGYAAALSMTVDGLVAPTASRHWAWAEISLWVGGLTLLLVTWVTEQRAATDARH